MELDNIKARLMALENSVFLEGTNVIDGINVGLDAVKIGLKNHEQVIMELSQKTETRLRIIRPSSQSTRRHCSKPAKAASRSWT